MQGCTNKIEEFIVSLQIESYQLYHNWLDNGRGVALYVDQNIKSSSIVPFCPFSEAVLVEIKLRHEKPLCVGCVDRIPSSSEENNNLLHDLMKEWTEPRYKDCLIVGDFNYRAINWDYGTASNAKPDRFLSSVKDNFLSQHQSTTLGTD